MIVPTEGAGQPGWWIFPLVPRPISSVGCGYIGFLAVLGERDVGHSNVRCDGLHRLRPYSSFRVNSLSMMIPRYPQTQADCTIRLTRRQSSQLRMPAHIHSASSFVWTYRSAA